MQRALIERILRDAECSVFLPESGLDADGAHADFQAWLVGHGAATERVASSEDGGAGPKLATRIFRETADPLTVPGVEMVSAPDTVREVWEAARACLAWAGEGIAFHEMAVVYRNGDPYHALVDEVFREAGIDTYLHDGRLLSTHPLGRRLLLLLELIADDTFPRSRVMEFLTETRLPRDTSSRYQRLRASESENYTREAGVVAGIEQWRERLGRLADEKRERSKSEGFGWLVEHADRVLELQSFVDDLHERLLGRRGEASFEEHLAFVREVAAAYADGLEPLLTALEEMKALSVIAERVSFATFLQAVRDDLDARDATEVLGEPLRHFGRHGVAVMDSSSLRHMRFRAVYLLGASERAWPPPRRPDPLLLEHERAALNSAASDGAALPLRTSPEEETLTFILALEAARERLSLSYARAEAGGGGRHLPSYFFRAMAQAIEGRELAIAEVDGAPCVRRLAGGRLASDDPGTCVTPAEYDRSLVRGLITGERHGVIDALAEFDEHDPLRKGGAIKRAMAARRARWGNALSAHDGVMMSADGIAAAAASRFGDQPASASRLEMYTACPYRYFLRYGLGIDALDEPEALDRIDHLERGSLIHAILERFLKEIGSDDPPSIASRDRHLPRLLGIASEEARACEDRGVTGRPLIWALDRRKIFDDLVRWYDIEAREGEFGELRPRAFEASFGPMRYDGNQSPDPHSMDEAVEIDLGGRSLRLLGRIDRIDYDDERSRFRVIDYKTGKAGPKKAKLDKGRSLQLHLYMQAASKMLGIPLSSGEAQYFYCTSRGEFKRTELSPELYEEQATDLEQVLRTAVEGVDDGMFAPFPGKDAFNCTWCDFRQICDARIGPVMMRKDGAPRRAAFIALQEIK
jgi:RecB family exonuclease